MVWLKFVLCDENGLWRHEFLEVNDAPPSGREYEPSKILWIHHVEAEVLLGSYDIDWPNRKDIYCLCVGIVDKEEVETHK